MVGSFVKAILQLGAPVGQNLEGLLDEDVCRANADTLYCELVAVRDLRDEDVVLCALVTDALAACSALAVMRYHISAVLDLEDVAGTNVHKSFLVGHRCLFVDFDHRDKTVESCADGRELSMI